MDNTKRALATLAIAGALVGLAPAAHADTLPIVGGALANPGTTITNATATTARVGIWVLDALRGNAKGLPSL
ncbi:hypothetical protein ACFWB2_40320 [Streptomyces virginiae]|uniref:hypothetical protein n=1 Tax=Streptomyces virginiae TaxID=1961 RepID=UPI00367CE3FD